MKRIQFPKYFILVIIMLLCPYFVYAAAPVYKRSEYVNCTELCVAERGAKTSGDSSPVMFNYYGHKDGLSDLIIGNGFGHIFVYKNSGTIDNPIFTTSVQLRDIKDAIGVGGFARPYFADWTNSGKKDLFVGNKKGEIRFYKNIGITNNPIFNTNILLVQTPGEYSIPYVYDWNGDGKKDLLVSWRTSLPKPLEGYMKWNIGCYTNTNTDSSPQLASTPVIIYCTTNYDGQIGFTLADMNNDTTNDLIITQCDIKYNSTLRDNKFKIFYIKNKSFIIDASTTFYSNNLNLGISPTISIYNWDNDSDYDLVTGNRLGRVWVYLNQGNENTPIFSNDNKLVVESDPNPIFLFYNSRAQFVDWDNDGLLDLFCGTSQMERMIYINSGTKTEPKYTTSFQIKNLLFFDYPRCKHRGISPKN